MVKQCPISNRTSSVGGKYSNKVRATRFNPTTKVRKGINLQKKRLFIPSLKKYLIVNITPRGMRTLKKQGIEKGLKKAGII